MKKFNRNNKSKAGYETLENRWQQILVNAISEPGKMLKAYQAFHNYSIGNQLFALSQCEAREIELGPINTYAGWQQLGRQVKKGEKAIELCMPLLIKRKSDESEQGREEHTETFTNFIFRRNWFVLSQTEGEEIDFAGTPEWSKEKALQALGIEQISFSDPDGNVQGYATKNKIAVSPIAGLPHKTIFHELAHVVLGHTAENSLHDSEQTPRNLREVEAESVALVLCETLQLEGAEFARGYIQSWLGEEAKEIPDASARKILAAADKILKAGIVPAKIAD